MKYPDTNSAFHYGDSFSGTMGEVVEDSTAHYSEEDRAAVTEYLLSTGR